MKKILAILAGFLFAIPAFAFDETITVSWSDAGAEDSYVVARADSTCVAAQVFNVIARPVADVLSLVDAVSDNADYCYRVKAVKNGQEGPWSAGFDVNVPAALSDITVTAVLN